VFILKPLVKRKAIVSRIVESFEEIEESVEGSNSNPQNYIGENLIDGPISGQTKYVV
jgi:hypothetical protein